MLKSFKNLVLYDIRPDDSQFLSNPGSFLKRVLFEDGVIPDNKNGGSVRGSRVSVHLSRGNSTASSSSSASSSASAASTSSRGSLEIVDDGHELGLGNPKILKLILINLPTTDLLKARLVNLRWNVTACSILRTKLPFVRIPPSKLKSFQKLMTKNISNPISSYAIRIDYVWDKETHKFLTRFANDIFHLRVRLNISEFTEFAKVLQTMKNLRDVHIIAFDDGGNKHNGYLTSLLTTSMDSWDSGYFDEKDGWRMGLYKFPKLEKLIFENSSPSYKIHPYYDKIVADIITACGQLQEVSFIEWNSPLGKAFSKFEMSKPGILDTFGRKATTEEITHLIFNANLLFYKLRLEVSPEVSLELVSDVIHKCSESLVELTLGNEDIFEKFSISSALFRLARLRLTYWSGPVDFTYFSRQFPALRQLSLNLSNLFEVESGVVDISMIEPCQMVKTLTLMKLETGVDSDLIDKLSRLFPAVTELFVEVRSGSVLETIYKVYPNLTLLCLELKNSESEENPVGDEPLMTNQAFTGVPDKMIKIIMERECGCPIIQFPEEVKARWNIGCLKNLTTLLLRVPNSVNNIALLEGMSRLSQLEKLVLLPFYSLEEEPTKWCLRSIADNFPRLQTLVTSTEVQYLDSDLEYLYSKLPQLVHKRKP